MARPPFALDEPGTPDDARAAGGERTLIAAWEVPLLVDGSRAVIVGQVTWRAPSSPLPWLGAALAVGAVAAAAVLHRRSRRYAPVVVAVAGVATAALLEASTATVTGHGLEDLLWALAALVLAAAATVRLAVDARKGAAPTEPALLACGLVLVLSAGLGHVAVLSSGYVLAAVPVPLLRGAVAVCLGVGAALVAGAVVPLVRSGRRPLVAPPR